MLGGTSYLRLALGMLLAVGFVGVSLASHSNSTTPLEYGESFPLREDRTMVYVALSSRCPICVPLFQELRSCIASWAIRGVGFKLIWVGQEAENRIAAAREGLDAWPSRFASIERAKSEFGVRVLPTVFVVGADGVVRHVLEGKRGDQSIMGLISLKLEETQSTQGD